MNITKKEHNNKLKYYSGWYKFLLFFYSFYSHRKPNLFPLGGKLPKGGNLILANHVTSLDQFFIIMYYETEYIRFVSGENVFKNPLFRFFAEKCLHIIIHMRGISSLDTIREMTKSLKQGENVMVFPSGTTTFDGKSQDIDPSIAKLAKMSSCNLILLKIDGGYFLRPRWGISTRKGKITLTEHIITADELKIMSPSDITTKINEHLFTDAYEIQSKNHIRYSGKDLCKGLESCIYECPECNKISNLKTSNSKIFCTCGFSALYDEYGYLNSDKDVSYTITELCDNQKQHLKNSFLAAREENAHKFLFGDNFELKYVYSNGKRKSAGNIRIDVYSDSIEYGIGEKKGILDYKDIESLFIFMRNTLEVNMVNKDYNLSLQGDFSCNALKYRDLFKIYKSIH